MATFPEKPLYRLTAAEYLAVADTSCERLEWLDGVLYAMAGESAAHGILTTNLTGLLHAALRGTPCQVRSKDTKVLAGSRQASSRRGLFAYPDVVVVCGPPQYLPGREDVLLNPRVLCEVLSPSTQAYDRGEKWARYRRHLPSLTAYVLVAQDQVQVDVWQQDGGVWHLETITGLAGTLALPSLGVRLALGDVYERLEI